MRSTPMFSALVYMMHHSDLPAYPLPQPQPQPLIPQKILLRSYETVLLDRTAIEISAIIPTE